jgi:hypothetical protein
MHCCKCFSTLISNTAVVAVHDSVPRALPLLVLDGCSFLRAIQLAWCLRWLEHIQIHAKAVNVIVSTEAVGGGLPLRALALARTICGLVITMGFHIHTFARFAIFLLTRIFSFTKRINTLNFAASSVGPEALSTTHGPDFKETASESCSAQLSDLEHAGIHKQLAIFSFRAKHCEIQQKRYDHACTASTFLGACRWRCYVVKVANAARRYKELFYCCNCNRVGGCEDGVHETSRRCGRCCISLLYRPRSAAVRPESSLFPTKITHVIICELSVRFGASGCNVAKPRQNTSPKRVLGLKTRRFVMV